MGVTGTQDDLTKFLENILPPVERTSWEPKTLQLKILMEHGAAFSQTVLQQIISSWVRVCDFAEVNINVTFPKFSRSTQVQNE